MKSNFIRILCDKIEFRSHIYKFIYLIMLLWFSGLKEL